MLFKYDKILKIKTTILDIQPEIWREILIENNITFNHLHKIIQISFGWTNSHLHNFEVDGKTFSVSYNEYENEDLDTENKIAKFLNRKGQKALYTYDLGDNWEHKIEVVDILEKEKNLKYPLCLAGERNAPPEDCGSVPGYENVMRALNDKGGKEDLDLLEWLGDYDPEEFDINEVNEAILNPDEYIFDLGDL